MERDVVERRETKAVWMRRRLATSSLVGAATLLAMSEPTSAAAACAISVTGASGPVSNSAAINCIAITGATVAGDVVNATPGVIASASANGIAISSSTINGAVVNNGRINVSSSRTGIVANNAAVSGGISNNGAISANRIGISTT